ncbi:hypothetical protein O9K51_05169 [Purpureocillium lavendulum]|uniref:Xylose isomerase-like TIM barrel domain-containing protein n=1 Tax=Purpureocillium lavendulum TaxID=1247861 RepID=A0AB34FS03_9HYPO|nr:hypothetical protein O9K51_05169 [Purpureocillium lavendulum]
MGIDYYGQSIPTSFASCSLSNRPGQTLQHKMSVIRGAGFDAMELAMPDVLHFAEQESGSRPDERDFDALVPVATRIRALAEEQGLDILMLQPFSRFEGWSASLHPRERQDALVRAKGWMSIMEALGTQILQVGSSDAEGIATCSMDDLAADLGMLADMCAEKGLRIAYENWCWATKAPTWRSVWDVVRLADRPNLGLCLDTFQAAGAELADPTTGSGYIDVINGEELQRRWANSLKDLATSVPPQKIYLLQISDGYRMNPPIRGKDEAGERPRSQWSHSHRPLPCDGGYLPVREALAAVLATGFRGWLSVEVFDPEKEQNMAMEKYTGAAMESLRKLLSLS